MVRATIKPLRGKMWNRIKCFIKWHFFEEKCIFSKDDTYKHRCIVRRKKGSCGKCQWKQEICIYCGKVKNDRSRVNRSA